MRSGLLPLVFGLAAIAVVSAASSFITLRIASRQPASPVGDYHDWIHKKLKMTTEQEHRSMAAERRYEETKRHLEEVVRLANGELAEAILRDKAYSSSVQKSMEEIHGAMGELQRKTLEHIFELRDVLDAEQYERLIGLTAQGLSENTRRN